MQCSHQYTMQYAHQRVRDEAIWKFDVPDICGKQISLFFCFIFVCFIFKGIWLINFKTFHQKCLLGVVWFCSLLTFVCLWICFEK